MNSKTRAKTDHEDIKKEIKKTAIVKPTIRPKQKSFNGFTHGSARIKKEEESFSSLPSEIQGKNRRVHKNRKLNIFSHDQNSIRKFQHKVNKSDIQRDELEEEIENDIGQSNELVDKENNCVISLEDQRITQYVIPNPQVLTKPLLDVIDDLCSGASSNCDRKKLSQEKRRKSLSQERIIGIKQFFRYSKLWRDIKGLYNVKMHIINFLL